MFYTRELQILEKTIIYTSRGNYYRDMMGSKSCSSEKTGARISPHVREAKQVIMPSLTVTQPIVCNTVISAAVTLSLRNDVLELEFSSLHYSWHSI